MPEKHTRFVLPHHQQLIDDSAISPSVANTRGYRTVTKPSELLEVGYADYQAANVPGLLIPIRDVFGENTYFHYRPDVPRITKQGKKLKYEAPARSQPVLDVPEKVREVLRKPEIPLFVTEGSRKVDAALSKSLYCIGLGGVWMWRDGKGLLPDWEAIALRDRDVIFVFDSDVMTKPEVRQALHRIAALVRRKGAKVWYILLPGGPDGEKVGLDDYFADGHSVDDLMSLMVKHLPGDEPDEPTIPFPLEVFPEALRRYVEETSSSIPVPPEMIAIPLLVELGSVIGNRAYFHLKNSWHEYGCLYVAMIAGPGKNKTAALKLARHPIKRLQLDARKHYQDQKLQYERDKASWREGDKETRGEEPQPPKMRHLYTTDSTLESLASILENSPGLMVSSDELSGWVKRMNQYRQGGDREQYMSIWAAEPMKVDRKGGGSVYVEKPVVGVFGGVQPDVVPSLHSTGAIRDGWVERLLPFMPDVPPKEWQEDIDVAPGTFAEVASLFRAIDSLPPLDQYVEGDDGVAGGFGIQMSSGAKSVWVKWSNQNNAVASEVGGFLGGFYTKLEAHVARFAFLLHVAANPPVVDGSVPEAHRFTSMRKMITRQEMLDAVSLGEYFRSQILPFVKMLNIDAPSQHGKIGVIARLERLIRAKGRKVDTVEMVDGLCLTTKEVLQGLNIRKEELTRDLDTLTDLGRSENLPGASIKITTHTVPTGARPAQYICLSDSAVSTN